jgi:hypothetical protein
MCRSVRLNSSFWAVCIASLAAFALCLSASPANAGDAALTWTLATQNTDGSAIPASGPTSLAATRVEWGTCSGSAFGTVAGQQTVATPATTYTITGLAAGVWCFRAYSRTVAGLESAPTNVVTKTILQSPPQPPGNLTVAALTVYQFIGTTDAITLLAVGTVPAGTACDPAQSVNGRYAVPRAAVTWYGSVRPRVVFAQCS